jgi:hypothetical protein
MMNKKETEPFSIPILESRYGQEARQQQQRGGPYFQCCEGHVHLKGRSADTGAAELSHGDHFTSGQSKVD